MGTIFWIVTRGSSENILVYPSSGLRGKPGRKQQGQVASYKYIEG
jgi:hypothetical protein